MRSLPLWLATAVALLLTGPASAVTKDQACLDYVQLRTSIRNLEGMGPESSANDLRAAEKQVESSYQQFSQSASQFAPKQTENLKKSVNQLAQTTQNIPPTATGAQARDMINGDLARVQVARDQVLRQLGCEAMGIRPPQTP